MSLHASIGEFLRKKKITNFLNCFLVIPAQLYLHIKNTKPLLGFNKHWWIVFIKVLTKTNTNMTTKFNSDLPRIQNEFELVKISNEK